jgi:hypothetical protein
MQREAQPEPDPTAASRDHRRVRRRALALAGVIFGVEVLIATRLSHWHFVRSSLGDYLVVFLLYFPALAVRSWPPVRLAAAVFGFSVLVEIAQALHLADALGFAPGSLGRVVLGATFSFSDVIMYGLGCLTCVFVDRRLVRGPRGF